MRNQWLCILSSFLLSLSACAALAAPYHSTKETLQTITPNIALKRLLEGNVRFVNNKPIQRNLLQQAKVTSLKGQYPAAVILSCMDSRGSPELILDQGLGDVFSVRVAGNVIDTDQIGSMEYATKVIGSKLIVVMGHNQCGAIKGACQNVELGNLTELLSKIQPAIAKVRGTTNATIDCNNNTTVDAIAKQNVLDMIRQINERSSIIHELISNNQVLMVGAMHDLLSGKVIFFDDTGNEINLSNIK